MHQVSGSISMSVRSRQHMSRVLRQSNLHPSHWVTVSVATPSTHWDFVHLPMEQRMQEWMLEQSKLIKQILSNIYINCHFMTHLKLSIIFPA